MKKTIRRLILLVTVIFLLVPMLTGCGKDMDKTVAIELESAEAVKGGMEISMTTKNDTGYNISLGWVGSCQIEVTTDEDTYYYEPFMTKISRGKGTLDILVEDCEGEVEKIVITELCLLDENGLPGKKMQDVVVFDESQDIDGFEDAFGVSLSTFDVMKVLVPVLMVTIVIVVIVIAIRTHKRNMQAAQAFNPYGVPQGFDPNNAAQQMHNQAMDMHNQAVNMHNQANQQFVQQENMRIHNDFAHQSVTPIDQGGFVPPPPPPMPPMGM